MSLRDCLASAVEQGAINSRQADELHRYYEARFNSKRTGMPEREAMAALPSGTCCTWNSSPRSPRYSTSSGGRLDSSPTNKMRKTLPQRRGPPLARPRKSLQCTATAYPGHRDHAGNVTPISVSELRRGIPIQLASAA